MTTDVVSLILFISGFITLAISVQLVSKHSEIICMRYLKSYFIDLTTKNVGFGIVKSILYTQYICSPLISFTSTTLENQILICSLKL